MELKKCNEVQKGIPFTFSNPGHIRKSVKSDRTRHASFCGRPRFFRRQHQSKSTALSQR